MIRVSSQLSLIRKSLIKKTDAKYTKKVSAFEGRKDSEFVHSVSVILKAGKGGCGAAGIAGGPGGIGGDIIFVGNDNLTIKRFRRLLNSANIESRKISEIDTSLVEHMSDEVKYYVIKAENGSNCKGRDKWGANGRNTVLTTPVGIYIKNVDTGNIMGYIDKTGDKIVIAKGGNGGKGIRGKGLSARQWSSPEERKRVVAENRGQGGEFFRAEIGLQKISDVAIIGYANAGKSTLMKRLTNMNVEISAKEFTTINPNIGVLKSEEPITIADLPGLIDGSHKGKGCGDLFLSMIERNRCYALVIDVNGYQQNDTSTYRTAFDSIMLLLGEILLFDPEFLKRPIGLILNKIDTDEGNTKLQQVLSELNNQSEIKSSKSYTIPVPLNDVIFKFIKPISAHNLSEHQKKKLIRQLRDLVPSETERDNEFTDEKLQTMTISQQRALRLKENLVQSRYRESNITAPENSDNHFRF